MPRSKGFGKKTKRRRNGAKIAKGGWGHAAALDVDDEEFHDASGPAAEEDEDEDATTRPQSFYIFWFAAFFKILKAS